MTDSPPPPSPLSAAPILSVSYPLDSNNVALQVGRSSYMCGRVAAIEADADGKYKVTLDGVSLGDTQKKFLKGEIIKIGVGNAAVVAVVVADTSYSSSNVLAIPITDKRALSSNSYRSYVIDARSVVSYATEEDIQEAKQQYAETEKRRLLAQLRNDSASLTVEQLAEMAAVMMTIIQERHASK